MDSKKIKLYIDLLFCCVFLPLIIALVPVEKWMEKYRAMGADVTYIADYVQDTYGQTLGQLWLAHCAAALISTFVTGAVVWLFIRLLVEKDRYAISLHKALGFTGADIWT